MREGFTIVLEGSLGPFYQGIRHSRYASVGDDAEIEGTGLPVGYKKDISLQARKQTVESDRKTGEQLLVINKYSTKTSAI